MTTSSLNICSDEFVGKSEGEEGNDVLLSFCLRWSFGCSSPAFCDSYLIASFRSMPLEETLSSSLHFSLLVAEAQEIERKRSSTVANQRSVPAQFERRDQDGWTSTPCVSDDIRKDNECDKTAGERLQEQRPHSIEKIKDEAGAQEVEGGSTTSSSTNTRRRRMSALIEHRCQDSWTFSLCTCGRSGCSGGCDVLAGERLPKQRPQGDDHPEHNSEEHLGAQVPHQHGEAGSIVFHSSSNASEFKNDNNEACVTASAAAKVSEDLSTKDAEILRLIEERRSTPKEEKQRLKELSKCLKNASEKKRMKRQQDIQEFLKTPKVYEISRESNQQRGKYSSQR